MIYEQKCVLERFPEAVSEHIVRPDDKYLESGELWYIWFGGIPPRGLLGIGKTENDAWEDAFYQMKRYGWGI